MGSGTVLVADGDAGWRPELRRSGVYYLPKSATAAEMSLLLQALDVETDALPATG